MGNLSAREVDRRFKSIRYRVWLYICEYPGCTDAEIQNALNLNVNTARPRRVELEQAELIRIVFPMKVVAHGNVADRWESTGLPYPEVWKRQPVAKSGDAMALRNAHRILRWAQHGGDQALVTKAADLEAAVACRVRRKEVV